MEKVLLIDGNSIMNRAFYGIMGNKMLTTKDGHYTNAIYGFLSIMFKNMEEVEPTYMAIAFDSKTAADTRKKMYEGYKKHRHAMPNELAEQMPVIKEILEAMNIKTIEMADYEGDDILGTLAKKFAHEDKDVYILSGDRDLFQLIEDHITVRIPRTKMGKTETEIYTKEKVEEEYGLEPIDLIEVKALMGDSSDEIPGVPNVGPKTGTSLIKQFKTIANLYKALEEGTVDLTSKLKDTLIKNQDLAELSKELGTINTKAPIKEDLEDVKIVDWDREKIAEIFKRLNFNRFIERFGLDKEINVKKEAIKINVVEKDVDELVKDLNEAKDANDLAKDLNDLSKSLDVTKNNDVEENDTGSKQTNGIIDKNLIFYFETTSSNDETRIIKKDILGIGIYEKNENIIYTKLNGKEDVLKLKSIMEDAEINKISYNIKEDYVLLKEYGINLMGIKYDADVAAYILNPTNTKHSIKDIASQYLDIDLDDLIPKKEDMQLNMFDQVKDISNKEEVGAYVYALNSLYTITMQKMKEDGSIKLFEEIEMPLVRVLGDMQFNGMFVEKQELEKFGEELKDRLEKVKKEIYEYAGEEFNINSTQQLGKILFEKLKLTEPKKNKKGYATDVETLEGIKHEHPIVEKVLGYRSLIKLSSTYVDGLIPFINPKDNRIHAVFNQTITATGRISCIDPNLQNLPSHEGEGKNIKKSFKAKDGYIYVDADYSQIELRVLAHISKDETMIEAFKNDEDIHKQVASRVFGVPITKVTKEQRSNAKAVNFGIIYGITAFGLSQQLKIGRKEAQNYIDNYLKKYGGIKIFMEDIVKKAEEEGFVETAFGRRRYVPELKSNNYVVRQFGTRVAMNTPIQGTAADIMKIAMNKVFDEIKNLDAKVVLQVHDELILEVKEDQKEQAKEILKSSMENATKLDVPLKVELSEGKTWFELK